MRTRWLAAFVLVGLAGPAAGAERWVKNGGNDGLDGSSAANAWATLGHASSVVNPGDVVRVLDGSYQGFYLSRSGTAGNPITFRAEGAAALITADNGTTPDGINVEGADHVVIDGFVVDNRTRAGIRVALSQFVTIRNCRAGYNGRWGIFSGFADDLTIENNETHHSQAEHGIYVSNSGDRPVIRGNHSHDNHANGIHMNGDESQGGDGTISGALVERNVIHGNGVGGGSGINMDGVVSSVVRNNLLYDNHASGVSLYRIDGATGSTGNVVVNNTIVSAADGRWCVNISGGSTGNTVRNNVLYNYHSFRGAITVDSSSRPGLASDYNAVIGRFSTNGGDTVVSLAAWQGLGYDQHSFVAAPPDLFVAPGTDFHLLPGGPAVDAGSAVGAPAEDLETSPRPVGAAVDVGAYELQLLSCGDGIPDPGEQCDEPGFACADGGVCRGCTCITPPVCGSGIGVTKPVVRMRASAFSARVNGEAVFPKPWLGIDPIAHGMRVVVDDANGNAYDVTVPGGAVVNRVGWRRTKDGLRWIFADRSGAHGGVRRIVLQDLSGSQDGRLRWRVTARGGSVALPDVGGVRTAVVVGSAANECAALVWNGPGGPAPRCTGDATRLRCR